MRRMKLALLATLSFFLPQAPERVETWPDGSVRERFEERVDADGTRVRHGAYESFFENGEKEAKGNYVDGRRDGKWTFRWENGERRASGRFTEGQRSGKWVFFKEDGSDDILRSGKWDYVSERDEDGRGFQGALLDKAKHGTWTYFRAGGQVLCEGEYIRGSVMGPWILWHADGSPEPDLWLTGSYFTIDEVVPLTPDELTSRELGASTWEPDPALVPLADAIATGAADEAELRRRGQELMPVVAWRLLQCDVATEDGDAEARRLHEALTRYVGSGWSWQPFGGEEATAYNRRTQLRWHTFAELVQGSSRFYDDVQTRNWIPRVEMEHGYLTRRWGPPRFQWMGLDEPIVQLPDPGLRRAMTEAALEDDSVRYPEAGQVKGIGGGVGGRFGGRFGGPRSARARGGSGTGAIIARARKGLIKELDPLRTGELSEGELFALLSFLDTSFRFDEKPNGPVLEPLLTRLCVAQADRQEGRSEPPQELRRRALETIALAEATLLSRDRLPALGQALDWAADGLAQAQNGTGSWSAQAGGARGDAATTALAWLALTSARAAGAQTGGDAQGGLAWLRERIDRKAGRVPSANVEPEAPNSEECATPLTALVLMLSGVSPEDPDVTPLVRWIGQHPPQEALPEPLWFSTYAAYQVGGETWERWNKKLKGHLDESQLKGGLWKASGRHDELATTAQAVLTLQVYTRYAKASRMR